MRKREIEGQKRTRRRSFKTGAEIDIATTPSVVEKANTFLASDNKACSDGGSRMDEHSNSKGTRTRNRSAS